MKTLSSLFSSITISIFAACAVLFSSLTLANDNWPHPNISQAVFATDVINRTPVDSLMTADTSIKKIFFYTNLRNLTNQKITHRWLYEGKNMAEVSFTPRGERWRVYSTKNLWHTWTGQWTVEVLNESGTVLYSQSFTYTK